MRAKLRTYTIVTAVEIFCCEENVNILLANTLTIAGAALATSVR